MMGMKNPRPIDKPTYHLSSPAGALTSSIERVERQLKHTTLDRIDTKTDDQHQIDGDTGTQVIDPTFLSAAMLLLHPIKGFRSHAHGRHEGV